MRPNNRTLWGIRWVRRLMPVALLLSLPWVAPLLSGQPNKERENGKAFDQKKKTTEEAAPDDKPSAENETKKPVPARPSVRSVAVHFIDGSSMRLRLREERIELNTPYGKLLIPVRDIERIEFATRIASALVKQIEVMIADLGHSEFQRRESASAELLDLGERAYLALLKAEKSTDKEVVRRVRDVLEKIRAEVPEEHLEIRSHDVVYTANSKFTGRLGSSALRVQTFQFGEQQLHLADVRDLGLPNTGEAESANVLPDPGNLTMFQGLVGQVQTFRVTGMGQGGQAAAPVQGGLPAGPGRIWVGPGGARGVVVQGGNIVWGTDTYTVDSSLALASVHAGVLKAGQTGVVRVRFLLPRADFQGSTRHGVTSMPFNNPMGAFQFVRGRGREAR